MNTGDTISWQAAAVQLQHNMYEHAASIEEFLMMHMAWVLLFFVKATLFGLKMCLVCTSQCPTSINSN